MKNKSKLSKFYLTIIDGIKFIDQKNNEDKTELLKKYSLAKYGSFKDIKVFAKIIVDNFFEVLLNKNNELSRVFEEAKNNNDYVVLMTPGYRNVKSSANIMFDIALPIINTKLALLGYPRIAKLKLPRLANPCENYASLTDKERKIIALTTDHILPDKGFYNGRDIHVIYGDDIHITGTSSDRAKIASLQNGAKSFISIYSIIIDFEIALNDPSIEEKINLMKVTGKLDNTALEIFEQKDFIPVLRSLRLILNKYNFSDLSNFLLKIPKENILKIYISYMTNESLNNKNYTDSVELIKEYLIENNIIGKDGSLLCI